MCVTMSSTISIPKLRLCEQPKHPIRGLHSCVPIPTEPLAYYTEENSRGAKEFPNRIQSAIKVNETKKIYT